MKKNIKILLTIFILFTEIKSADANFYTEQNITSLIEEEDAREELSFRISDFKRDYIMISLGHDCSVAAHIRKYGLSEHAFPLNWVITPFASLYKLFDHDFKGLFEKNNLYIDGPGAPGFIGVYDTQYNIHSRHDFKKDVDFVGQQEAIRQKYERRCERLMQAVNSKKFVYFVRWGAINRSNSLKLADLIHRKFPKLQFTLVAIGESEEFKSSWNLPNIKNYFLKSSELWTNPTQYESIFKQLGLLK